MSVIGGAAREISVDFVRRASQLILRSRTSENSTLIFFDCLRLYSTRFDGHLTDAGFETTLMEIRQVQEHRQR
jgi:hypothetical protein